jgi:hypothetical protein
MDGGAFVVSVGEKDIGKARRIVDAPMHCSTNAKPFPPLPPLLVFNCCML